MRNTIRLLCVTACMLVSGCALTGDQNVPSGPIATNNDVYNAVSEYTGKMAGLIKERSDSTNAIQTNMNSLLGASIGKVADDMTGVKVTADGLVKASAELKSNVGDISNKLEVAIRANVDLQAKMELQAKVTAELQAKLNAVATAQAGIGNKVDSAVSDLKQNFSAGHDVVQDQFTPEMLKGLQSANHMTIWACAIGAGVISLIAVMAALVFGFIVRASRLRAEGRAKEMLGLYTCSLPKR